MSKLIVLSWLGTDGKFNFPTLKNRKCSMKFPKKWMFIIPCEHYWNCQPNEMCRKTYFWWSSNKMNELIMVCINTLLNSTEIVNKIQEMFGDVPKKMNSWVGYINSWWTFLKIWTKLIFRRKKTTANVPCWSSQEKNLEFTLATLGEHSSKCGPKKLI
jgi:hypothetical protein